jgi:hypothetical protein
VSAKFILGWAALSAVLCMTMAASADNYETLEIRTIKMGSNLLGVTKDRRVVGIVCRTGLSSAVLGAAARLVFPLSTGELDLEHDPSDVNFYYAPERAQVRKLTPAAANELCAVRNGDFKLAVYSDRADLLSQGEDVQVQSFNDILHNR